MSDEPVPPRSAGGSGARPLDWSEMTTPTYSVTLTPSMGNFEASASETLLQASLRAKVHLPVSCRNGTCRACISRLTRGKVIYHIAWPGLSKEEKDDGFILPCVAHAASDLVVDQEAAQREA